MSIAFYCHFSANSVPSFCQRTNLPWLEFWTIHIITHGFCLVIGILLPIYFTIFATPARGLNQGTVFDAIIINTFISRVISIMFPICSRVFPITQATRIASIYIITFQNGVIYGVVPNFKSIHSLKTVVLQTFQSGILSN